MSIIKRKLKTNSRVISELLTKYRNTFTALLELVNNSLQADSKNVYINIEYGDPHKIEPFIKQITVKDDGHGVSLSEFDKKILEIGTTVKYGGQGIGRFGCLQIGAFMEIETVSHDKALGVFTKVSFPLDTAILQITQLDEIEFDLNETKLGSSQKSYYKVLIKNLYHSSSNKISKKQKLTEEFKPDNIRLALFQQYPFDIFNQRITFHVNGEKLLRDEFIIGDPIVQNSDYTDVRGEIRQISLLYYNIKSSLNKVKIFFCINNAGIQTPAYEFTYSSDWYTPDLGTWFIYVESMLFDSDLFRNVDMVEWENEEFDNLKSFLKDGINEFFKTRNEKFKKFIDKIEKDDANPIKNETVSPSHKNVFNKVAFLIEDEYGLIENNEKIRNVVYPLINSAIESGHIQSIFEKVIKLSAKGLEKLHTLLEKTDLENVIHFASQVAEKQEFLEFLHEIVYGELSKVLKERCQLHKIIEKELWTFGENYNNAPVLWSDRKIGNIFDEIRQKYFVYEPSKDDENLIETSNQNGLDDITDLFFYNEKILDNGYKEFMIVELKSPKCAISQKELNQIDRYAYTIEQHNALPADKVKYKVVLVSSKLSDFAKSKMASARQKYDIPFMLDKKEGKEVELYVIEWRELIEANKRKLQYLANSLEIKEREVREKFETEYPEILDEKTKSTMRRTKEVLTK